MHNKQRKGKCGRGWRGRELQALGRVQLPLTWAAQEAMWGRWNTSRSWPMTVHLGTSTQGLRERRAWTRMKSRVTQQNEQGRERRQRQRPYNPEDQANKAKVWTWVEGGVGRIGAKAFWSNSNTTTYQGDQPAAERKTVASPHQKKVCVSRLSTTVILWQTVGNPQNPQSGVFNEGHWENSQILAFLGLRLSSPLHFRTTQAS